MRNSNEQVDNGLTIKAGSENCPNPRTLGHWMFDNAEEKNCPQSTVAIEISVEYNIFFREEKVCLEDKMLENTRSSGISSCDPLMDEKKRLYGKSASKKIIKGR